MNMRDITLKACKRSYLVGKMSKVLTDTSSTSILCVCERRRHLVHKYTVSVFACSGPL